MRIFIIMLGLVSATLWAPIATAAPARACDPQAARSLVGKAKPSDRQARRITKAAQVRQIRTGQFVTQDFRDDRVTIETNPRSGRVVRASCG